MPTAAEVEALEHRAAAAEAERGRLLAALDEARSGAAGAVASGGGIAGVLMEVRRRRRRRPPVAGSLGGTVQTIGSAAPVARLAMCRPSAGR